MRRIIAWVPCAFISNVSSSNPFGFTSARLSDLDGTIANFLQTDIIDVIGNAATSGIDTIILSHPEGLGDGSGVTGVGGNALPATSLSAINNSTQVDSGSEPTPTPPVLGATSSRPITAAGRRVFAGGSSGWYTR